MLGHLRAMTAQVGPPESKEWGGEGSSARPFFASPSDLLSPRPSSSLLVHENSTHRRIQHRLKNNKSEKESNQMQERTSQRRAE